MSGKPCSSLGSEARAIFSHFEKKGGMSGDRIGMAGSEPCPELGNSYPCAVSSRILNFKCLKEGS
jgi:hypothetical protein